MEGEVELVERAAVPVGGVPFLQIDCAHAWENLTAREKLYAHFLSAASWAGAPVAAHQCSRESATLLWVVQRCFRGPRAVRDVVAAVAAGVGSDDVAQRFVEYAASVLGNQGNYLNFGDTKFVPQLTRAQFVACVRAATGDDADTVRRAEGVCDAVFALSPASVRHLGFDAAGVTSYYSADVTKREAEAVQAVLDRHHLNSCNTRCAKTRAATATAPAVYRVVLASAEKGQEGPVTYTEDGIVVEVVRGDFATYMARVAANLEKAAEYAATDTEREMLREYVAHFRSGSVDEHKAAQRAWVRNQNPVVETNIGFIESYRDPLGVRAEWEGWVAVVDKVLSRAFATLVELAPSLLGRLPWGPQFEKTRFIKPDFTAIDVIAFATSGIPLGINLPNYDDVREQAGFKNVSLSNILRAAAPRGTVSFLSPANSDFYLQHFAPAWDIGVGLHELLGHGSGRLLVEGAFDPAAVVSPLTGRPVASWYKPGQTYDSVFKQRASPMEECRAECVSLVLCGEPEVLRAFGHNPDDVRADADDDVHDIVYANYLQMARAGLVSLEYYVPDTQQWMQAHSQARYAILRTLLAASRNAAARTGRAPAVEIVLSPDRTSAELRFDRTQLRSVALPAITQLLLTLQVYRATADAEGAARFWSELTAVDMSDPDVAALRALVLQNRQPRKLYIQPVTELTPDGTGVAMRTFSSTPVGMIESFQARFPHDDAIDLSADIIA